MTAVGPFPAAAPAAAIGRTRPIAVSSFSQLIAPKLTYGRATAIAYVLERRSDVSLELPILREVAANKFFRQVESKLAVVGGGLGYLSHWGRWRLASTTPSSVMLN